MKKKLKNKKTTRRQTVKNGLNKILHVKFCICEAQIDVENLSN